MSQTNIVPSAAQPSLARKIATAALLIALGNIASRVLGVGRESVIAGVFGRSDVVDAFTAASAVPSTLYDLLVNGAISAALIPVFSEYAEGDEREFWRIASSVINIALLAIVTLMALMMWQAPLVVTVLAGGFRGDIRELAIQMVRLMLPAVVFMGLSGLVTALLQARQKFLLPAFTTSAYNLGIILGALLLTPVFGPLSLVVGVLIGAFMQVVLQLPGLRGAHYRLLFDFEHPAVRRILKLYAPVAMGIGFSILGIVLDRNLASRVGDNALATMRYATTLIQFPLGLVVAAVSFAVLPTLSRQVSDGDEHAFRTTLAMGMKVVMLLILPATLALLALASPIVATILQRRAFSATDTAATAWALRLYLPGLPAAAFDQMLLFAFYANRRTLAPNLVQGAAVGVYAATALGLLATTQLGYGALVLGNSAQWIGHALLLLLLSRGLVSLHGLRLGESLLKCGAASIVMALVAWGAALFMSGFGGALAQLIVAGGLGAIVYVALCLLLHVEALDFFVGAVRRRVQARRG
jgi:putative peptidoglycan lipid II flippase